MSRIDETTHVPRIPEPRRTPEQQRRTPQQLGNPEQRGRPVDPLPAPRSRGWPIALVTATALILGGVAWVVVGVDRGSAAEEAPIVGLPVDLVHAEALTAAATTYRAYAVGEAAALRGATGELVSAVADRRVAAAQAIYPRARAHWERIHVAAQVFGDLAAAIDGHGVGLDPGATFTGLHRLERDLWRDGVQPDTDAIAGKLLADVTALADAVPAVEFSGLALCHDAKELLDVAVVTALPGLVNRWADTDLADLAARVEGSRAAVDALRPLLSEIDPALLAAIDQRFTEAVAVLDTHRVGAGYRLHSELTPADLTRIAVVLDAVGEPVSRLAVAVITG